MNTLGTYPLLQQAYRVGELVNAAKLRRLLGKGFEIACELWA